MEFDCATDPQQCARDCLEVRHKWSLTAPKFVPLVHGCNCNWSRTCRYDGGGDGG